MLTNLLPTLIQNSKTKSTPVGVKEYIGWSAWFVGFVIQAVADHQKSAFRANPANAVSISNVLEIEGYKVTALLFCGFLNPVCLVS